MIALGINHDNIKGALNDTMSTTFSLSKSILSFVPALKIFRLFFQDLLLEAGSQLKVQGTQCSTR